MAKETYRIEIPIETVDKYSSGLDKAEKDVKNFEKSTTKLKTAAQIASEGLNDIGKSAKKNTEHVTKFQSSMEKTVKNMNQSRFSKGWEFTIKAKDQASKVISSISSFTHRIAGRSYSFTVRAIDMASRAVRSIGRMITSIPAVITVALSVVGVSKLSEATVGAAMSFEQYEVSMTHWLDGNTKKAKDLVNWMGQFADSTPFSSPDLFPALARGVGVADGNVGEAKRLLKITADMAALMPGKTPMDAMEAMADAKMGQFERLNEFGLKISKEDYKAMGGWEGLLKKTGSVFEDGAKKLSETSLGVLMTLNGYRSSILRSLGDGILKPMKPRLDAINQWLADNQETWGRWKSKVKEHGEKASEYVFSRLQKGFNYVRSRYLDNDEFMEMDFKGKINFVMNDINEWWSSKGKPAVSQWWESTGQPWATDTGLLIGEAIFEGIKTGITKGWETLGDMWGNVGESAKDNGVFSKETISSAGGAGIATLGAGVLASMVLSPLLKVLSTVFKPFKWIFDKSFDAGKWAADKTSGNNTKKDDKKSSGKDNKVDKKPSSGNKPSTPTTKTQTPKQTGKFNPKGLFSKLAVPLLGLEMFMGGSKLLSNNFDYLKEEKPAFLTSLYSLSPQMVMAGWGMNAYDKYKSGKSNVSETSTPMSAGGSATANTQVVDNSLTALSNSANLAANNMSTLATYLGQASGWVVGGLYPLQESGALINNNSSILSMYLAQASGWVVGAFYSVQTAGSLVANNARILASYLGQASGWVVGGLYGIQTGGNQVKTALSNLAARIRNVSVPSAGGTVPSGTPKYANGGVVNRPHLGLVGEAGPEMIIPLSSGRRNRAMELFQRTGQMLGVRQYASGGLVGAEPLVNMNEPVVAVGGGTVSVDINAPISLMFDGSSGIDDVRVKDIVTNEINKFVTNVKEALSNMPK